MFANLTGVPQLRCIGCESGRRRNRHRLSPYQNHRLAKGHRLAQTGAGWNSDLFLSHTSYCEWSLEAVWMPCKRSSSLVTVVRPSQKPASICRRHSANTSTCSTWPAAPWPPRRPHVPRVLQPVNLFILPTPILLLHQGCIGLCCAGNIRSIMYLAQDAADGYRHPPRRQYNGPCPELDFPVFSDPHRWALRDPTHKP